MGIWPFNLWYHGGYEMGWADIWGKGFWRSVLDRLVTLGKELSEQGLKRSNTAIKRVSKFLKSLGPKPKTPKYF